MIEHRYIEIISPKIYYKKYRRDRTDERVIIEPNVIKHKVFFFFFSNMVFEQLVIHLGGKMNIDLHFMPCKN